jgi:hypothetical protein
LELPRHLQQQGRLADAGLATYEDHRAGDDSAAKYEVELLDSGLEASALRGAYLT